MAFFLESFRRGRDAAVPVVPHAEKLPSVTVPVDTVENARFARVVNGLSTRTRHPVYMSVLCYCHTTRAHATLIVRTVTTLACPSMPVYLCPMPLPTPLEMLDIARNLFLLLSTARVGMTTSFTEAYTHWIPRHTIMHYALCQTDYVSTS